MKNSLFACATAALLSSCATYDLEYRNLEAVAEASPAADAIVGMWHRRATDGWGLQLRQSFLFNRDGTGVDSYHHRDWLIGEHDETVRFTWRHVGGGMWKTQSAEVADYDWEYRLSQGKLIRKGSFALNQQVLERIPHEPAPAPTAPLIASP